VYSSKAAELNKFSVPEWSIWAVFWASVLSYGNMVIYWILGSVIVLIFYDFRDIYSSKKCQMLKDLSEL
jgi:hypothetical protein